MKEDNLKALLNILGVVESMKDFINDNRRDQKQSKDVEQITSLLNQLINGMNNVPQNDALDNVRQKA